MHHKPVAKPTGCGLQGMTSPSLSMLNSLLGAAGFLPVPTAALLQRSNGPQAPLGYPLTISRLESPDSPPPKA
jgi:hypothetical protein